MAPIDAADRQHRRAPMSIRRVIGKRGQHGDRHADDAEEIAAARGQRVRQTLERQDEEDAGDEVAERD